MDRSAGRLPAGTQGRKRATGLRSGGSWGLERAVTVAVMGLRVREVVARTAAREPPVTMRSSRATAEGLFHTDPSSWRVESVCPQLRL